MSEKSKTNNFLWKFAERFSAQIVSFIVSLVLARLLLPDDYGAVSLVLVFISLANALVSSGLGSALIQRKNADELDFSSVLIFNVGLSLIIYATFFILAPLISDFYNEPLLVPVIRVLAIRVVFASINTVQQAYVAKRMIFKKFFLATLSGTLISGIIGIWLAYCGFGVWALVTQYLCNTIIDTIVLAFTLRWKPKIQYSRKRVKGLFKFGWKVLFEGVANTLAVQVRNLIIGKVYTKADLGYYTKAQQFPQLIMDNINASASAVLFPALSELQDDDSKLIALTRKAVRVSSYVLFPMMFGLAAVASNLVTVLLTDKWQGAVPFIYVYCFTYLVSIGMYARHEALKAKGRSDVFMIEHIASRILNFSILLLVFRISVMAIALSGVAGSILLGLIIMFTSKKYNGYRYRDQFKDVFGLLMMSIAIFVPTFLFGYLVNINPIIELTIQVILGVLIYLGLSVLFKPEGYLFIISFIKNLLRRKK